ncbi:MAG: hypothetical protein GY870_19465 [archaeon]|nr:hypothetical protein [archaeon]
MLSGKHENIIFYINIVGKAIKRKELTKCLANFIKEKKKKNPLTNFGMLIFKEGGIPDFVAEGDPKEIIIKKLEKEWKNLETTESLFENGLMYCLSYIASKSTQMSGDNRVVVLSDTPSTKIDDYHDAIFGLINTVRFIPTFIDIIRIGNERFYSDDVKLRIYTNTASGGLFYAQDGSALDGILTALTKNKRLANLNQPEGKIYIDDENKAFYENLAAEMLTPEPNEENGICCLCNQEFCDDTEQEYTSLLKCYNCSSFFHLAHAAKFAFEKNIGLAHVFRCPKCDVLLKIDEKLVLEINGITPEPEIEEQVLEEEEEIIDYQYSAEVPIEEELVEIPSYQEESSAIEVVSSGEDAAVDLTRVSPPPPMPGGFSFFSQNPRIQTPVSQESNNSDQSSTSEQYWNPNESIEVTPQVQPVVPIAKPVLNSPESSAKKKRKRRIRSFTLCTVCGETNGSYNPTCKKCGAPLNM